MHDSQKRARLETEAIVLGYAMSRLDLAYLHFRQAQTWRQAFQEAARAVFIPASSIKNLRDEFDPIHGNRRQGWHQRPLRANRQSVLDDLKDVSDEALMALVDRILARDEEATAEAIDSMALVPSKAHNVAERLLTGRRAEEYFLAHSQAIAGLQAQELIDHRQAACGFDFGVRSRPIIEIEVKGLKRSAGELLFTDREWAEAKIRRGDYWLVVVGNLDSAPGAVLVPDPHEKLSATCSYQVSVVPAWRSRFSLVS